MTPGVVAVTLVWGAAHWLAAAAAAVALLLALLAWGYWRAGVSPGVKFLSASLKALAVFVLALCLLEPLFSGTRARPGANQFVVLADNSRSMGLHDQGSAETRGQRLKSLWHAGANWPARLGQDFDVRQYAFDTQLRPLPDPEALVFDGAASDLAASLQRLAARYRGRPLAGVLLFTDGTATDAEKVEKLLAQAGGDGSKLPPVYPVLVARDAPAKDLDLQGVAVTQTNFEDAPVTLTAQLASAGYAGKAVVAELLDESAKLLERQTVRAEADGKPLAVRFKVKPEQPGVSFYRVRVAAEGEPLPPVEGNKQAVDSPEATLENNARLVAVDRGKGPYRVLYVAGRPNWEFKFLQRAEAVDEQVRLDALLRIAKREPKFNFIARRGYDRDANPLFQGFDNEKKDDVEQYDQPVIVRIFPPGEPGAENKLRGGFPKTAEELYQYHAVILDDVEGEFFTQDQMQLLKEFVRQRGGGLLMLGGTETFKNGKYDRTPIGDMLPVYADEVPSPPPDARYRLALTREGWLEPWVRLRGEEDAERKRLEAMPAFQVVNPVRGIKPGATVLARVEVQGEKEPVPALVEQRFGQGRVGALLVGDLWRWSLRRADPEKDNDFEKAWRQTVRWLVADVPRRADLSVEKSEAAEGAEGAVTLAVRARDPAYAPLDNATVNVRVTGPGERVVELRAEQSGKQPGLYEAAYVPRQPGPYRAHATVAAPDGSEVGQAQAGWTSDPAAEEFRDLRPNRQLLDRLARATGGQVVEPGGLESFVATLPTRHADVTEPYVRPVWHQPWVFALAIACLCAEWGLRRWRGLP